MNDQLNGGPLTNWLAIIGVISLIYWGWRIAAAILGRRKESTDAAAALATSIPAAAAHGGTLAATPLAAPPEDIAVIAAAVSAIVGNHRIVRLEARPEQAWALEGRWMLQTSHKPR